MPPLNRWKDTHLRHVRIELSVVPNGFNLQFSDSRAVVSHCVSGLQYKYRVRPAIQLASVQPEISLFTTLFFTVYNSLYWLSSTYPHAGFMGSSTLSILLFLKKAAPLQGEGGGPAVHDKYVIRLAREYL